MRSIFKKFGLIVVVFVYVNRSLKLGKVKKNCCIIFRRFRLFVDWKGIDILGHVLFSNEAWFHLNGYVNSQYREYRIRKRLTFFTTRPLLFQKIGNRCAVTRRRFTGTLCYENTVNGNVYQEFLLYSTMVNIVCLFLFQQDLGCASSE